MKVLLVSHTCQSRTEGQPKAFELARLGVELCVVVPQQWMHYGQWRPAQVPENAPFRFEVLPAKWAWCGPAQSYLHFYPGMEALIRDFKPDVIDLWEEPWSLVSLRTLRLRDRLCPDVPLVSETEQNIDKRLPPPFEPIRSRVLKGANFVVGRNAQSLEIVARKGFEGPSRVVPNAVDAELFHPLSEQERKEKREQLGWGEGEFWCGYVGRLVEEKGIGDLLDALVLCDSAIHVVIVGDGTHKPELEVQIGRLGLQERVQMRAGLPPSELAPLMGALDALVLPSRTTARWKEQFGRVLIEANACGVAAVGSDSGAIPDVVGQGGRIFPEGDDAALAEILVDLAGHPEEARRLGREGRRSVLERYTWARVAEAMKGIYEELLAARTAR
ncbi:alpha-maltose-1-phosphate synthase [Abditibacteriota bacterium]|nr:alpha-maltose-1-phosphate synthase [Abditibacteriota bacterium]